MYVILCWVSLIFEKWEGNSERNQTNDTVDWIQQCHLRSKNVSEKRYVASHSYFLCIKNCPSMVSEFLQNKSGWHRILEDEFLANNTIDLRDSICISLLCDCSNSVPSSLEAPGDASYQTLRLPTSQHHYLLSSSGTVKLFPVSLDRSKPVVSQSFCITASVQHALLDTEPLLIQENEPVENEPVPLPNVLVSGGWKRASSADRCEWLDDPLIPPPPNTRSLECLDTPLGQNLWFASNQQKTAKVMKCHFHNHVTEDWNAFLAHRLSLFWLRCCELTSMLWGPCGKEVRATLRQQPTSPTTCKKWNSANNHMNLVADASPVKPWDEATASADTLKLRCWSRGTS